VSFKYGYGLGGGFIYNPRGTSPGWDSCREHGVFNIGIGGYGNASAGLGPAFLGISGNAGLDFENQLGIFSYYGVGLEYGLRWGWSLRAGVAVGGEITFY
ncbi:MAG: hypothetical protein GTN76_03105, partial [Candidatus Aenigmarchaeota archaeon]|nr:hypothetical protein [Candidatus Aenigmarchaeota archaeon]